MARVAFTATIQRYVACPPAHRLVIALVILCGCASAASRSAGVEDLESYTQVLGPIRIVGPGGRDVPGAFGVSVDVWCTTGPGWPGRVIPPGSSLYAVQVWREYRLDRHAWDARFGLPELPAGEYGVRARWYPPADSRDPRRRRDPLAALDVMFRIRPRTTSEESMYRDLEAMGARHAAWSTARGGLGEVGLAWADRRLAADSTDPFVVPALELMMSRAAVDGELRRGSPAAHRLADLQHRAARAQRHLPAGAYAVLRAHAGRYWGTATSDLSVELAGSLAGNAAASFEQEMWARPR